MRINDGPIATSAELDFIDTCLRSSIANPLEVNLIILLARLLDKPIDDVYVVLKDVRTVIVDNYPPVEL